MIDGWTQEPVIFNLEEYSEGFSCLLSMQRIFNRMLITKDSFLSVYKQTGHAFTVNTLSLEAYQTGRPKGLNAEMCVRE